MSLVDAKWLAAHLDDSKVRLVEVDAEWAEGYAASHIPGAVGGDWKEVCWDPLSREFPTAHDFARRMGAAGIGNDTTIVIYGDPVPFGFYAWWVFTYCGHRDVRLLDGGKPLWKAEGRLMTADVPSIAPVEYNPVARRKEMRATRDDVLRSLARPGVAIVDGRSADEYFGRRVNMPDKPDHGAERYGRIPGARHLDAHELLNHDGTLQGAAALREAFESRRVGADKEIICYCRRAHRAALLWFALAHVLGFPKVRTYDGSWTEWGNLVGVPIER
jgi:thiosulfate/3-mercaptopyruvate sulfurtransferase